MRAAEVAKPALDMAGAPKATMRRGRLDGGIIPMETLLPFHETVFRLCLGYAQDYAQAEDLTQEAYLKAYQRLTSLRNPSRAKEWLCRLAKNACLDHQKKIRTRRILLRRSAHEPEPPSRVAADKDLDRRSELLKSAIRSLPKKLREPFVLREYGRLTYEELADTLGLNKGTVMSRLSRARRRVAVDLQEKTYG
jgi:RNA polymerase sigma-70 factor (ECF subfamily)